MTKQHITILVIAFVAAIGLAGAAVYKFDHRAHVPAGISIQQALNERQDAIQELNLERETTATNTATDTEKITGLTNQKVSLCAQLKVNKLVNPYCQ